jgi:hypothetical protein
MVCGECGRVYVAVTFVEEVVGRGNGAKGRIAKIRKERAAG